MVGWWGGVPRLGWVKDAGLAFAPGSTPLAFCLQDQEGLDLAGLSLLRQMAVHYGKGSQGNPRAMTSKEMPTVVPNSGRLATLVPPIPPTMCTE